MSYLVPTYDKFVWQTPVLDKDLVIPPVGVKGNRYIVAGNGGAWNGHIGDITYYDGSNWQFITKNEGMRVYVTDEHIYYYFNGTIWVLDNFFTATLKTKLDGIEASAVALATVKADVDIASAISLKHTQNTDTQLDSGVIAVDGNDNLTINQNNVAAFKSENTGALVNTLYLKTGNVGIGVVPTTKLHVQVPSAGNKQALLVEQLDTTNNPLCAEIDNNGTGYGLYIHQDGVLAASKHGLYVYSNAAQVNSPLVFLYQNNASSTQVVLEIRHEGSGNVLRIDGQSTGNGILIDQSGNGRAFEINNDGTNHGLYMHQDGVLASGKYAFYVYSATAQITSTYQIYFNNSNASSTIDMFGQIYNGTGTAMYIQQDGVLASGKVELYVHSGVAQTTGQAGSVFQFTDANSTIPLVELNNDGKGHGLYIHQDGNLATGKYALYLDNNGTPADGAGRAIRLDGCTIVSTKSPETDAEVGFIAVNIDGTQYAVPYYALS